MKRFNVFIAALLITTLTPSVSFSAYLQSPIPFTKGGTGSSSQTASRAVTTDGSGHLVSSSSTTATEIGYVNGVTSAIQTQLNAKASTALDNIASVALSADLICATSGSCKLGSAAKPFGDSFLNILKDASSVASVDSLNRLLKNSSGNTSISYAGTVLISSFNLELLGSTSGNIQISSGATPTAHTVMLPPTVCTSGQYWSDNGSGVMSCTSVSTPVATVADGGNAPYTILAGDSHVRTGTTLTAARAYTLPACTGSNIGERHVVKDTPAQTFVIHVAAAGSDDIDGAAQYDLNPGDSVSVICAFFSTNGTWDIE